MQVGDRELRLERPVEVRHVRAWQVVVGNLAFLMGVMRSQVSFNQGVIFKNHPGCWVRAKRGELKAGHPRGPPGDSSKETPFKAQECRGQRPLRGEGWGAGWALPRCPAGLPELGCCEGPPARGTPAPQGLPSLLQTGSPIPASAKPSPVPPPPPIGSAAGECHAGPDVREGRGASRMCLGPTEAPGSEKGKGGNQEARKEEVAPSRQALGRVQPVGRTGMNTDSQLSLSLPGAWPEGQEPEG